MTRTTSAVLVAMAMLAAACGGADAAGSEPTTDGGPAAGTCLEGTPDCVDTDLGGSANAPDGEEPIDEGAMIREATDLLGEREEAVLAAREDVRVGRRGSEQMMLTEDYVLGRKTIATEDDGTGTYRVVEVSIELTEGPHVVSAD
jgi:hypothetical protein